MVWLVMMAAALGGEPEPEVQGAWMVVRKTHPMEDTPQVMAVTQETAPSGLRPISLAVGCDYPDLIVGMMSGSGILAEKYSDTRVAIRIRVDAEEPRPVTVHRVHPALHFPDGAAIIAAMETGSRLTVDAPVAGRGRTYPTFDLTGIDRIAPMLREICAPPEPEPVEE